MPGFGIVISEHLHGKSALPEIWFCQVVIGAILWFPMTALNTFLTAIAASGDFSVTTANPETLLSPRAAQMLACSFLMVLFLLVGEICAPICLSEAIQKQEKTGVFSILKKSIRALPRFFTPSGLLILLYILFASPLVGTGLYLSMTETLYIPRFITDVIDKNMTYAVLYRVVLFVLGLLGFIYMFVFHDILIDGERPRDAMRRSRHYFARHWKTILIAIIQITLAVRVLYAVQAFVFDDLPQRYLDSISSEMPRGTIFNILEVQTLTDDDITLLLYRSLCILQVYLGQYAFNIFLAISSCGTFMVLTRLYLRFRKEEEGHAYEPEKYDLKPRDARHVILTLLAFLVPVLLVCLSVFMAVFFNQVFPEREKTAVVAHRTGGYLASENSLEGLDEAASHGCYGGETDIQRTKDRHYIINHDNDFARLTGDPHKPSEMSLEEIKKLKIRDTTGSGKLLPVPTLEELLDHGKGKVKLFLELKGESADYEMVEDVVKAGKRAGVWTVNTRRAMKRFLDSEADLVITDDILMAVEVQKELDERTDYDVVKDRSSDLWFY